MDKFKNVLFSLLGFIKRVKTELCLWSLFSSRFNEIICWVVLIIIVFLAVTLFFPNFRQQEHIGVVNITGIVDEFVKTQAKNELSREEIKKKVQVFGKELEKTMQEISVKKRAVLMPSEAVIFGATNYTSEVQKLLKQRADKGKK